VGVSFKITYHELVVREDIPALNGAWRTRVKKAIDEKLTVAPEVFGKPLRKSLAGYRKLRVADWRVIFRIEGKVVKIFVIAYRSRVYEQIYGRI